MKRERNTRALITLSVTWWCPRWTLSFFTFRFRTVVVNKMATNLALFNDAHSFMHNVSSEIEVVEKMIPHYTPSICRCECGREGNAIKMRCFYWISAVVPGKEG